MTRPPVPAYIGNALNDVTRETLFRPKCDACRACNYLFSDQEAWTVQETPAVGSSGDRIQVARRGF